MKYLLVVFFVCSAFFAGYNVCDIQQKNRAHSTAVFHDDMLMDVLRNCGASYDHDCTYWQYPHTIRFHRQFEHVDICTEALRSPEGFPWECKSLGQVVKFLDNNTD